MGITNSAAGASQTAFALQPIHNQTHSRWMRWLNGEHVEDILNRAIREARSGSAEKKTVVLSESDVAGMPNYAPSKTATHGPIGIRFTGIDAARLTDEFMNALRQGGYDAESVGDIVCRVTGEPTAVNGFAMRGSAEGEALIQKPATESMGLDPFPAGLRLIAATQLYANYHGHRNALPCLGRYLTITGIVVFYAMNGKSLRPGVIHE